MPDKAADLLRLDYINNLPQPLLARFCGDGPEWRWPVETIDVQTGLLRIDVCGKLQVKHISEAAEFLDADGGAHDPDTFYNDYEAAEVNTCPRCHHPVPHPCHHIFIICDASMSAEDVERMVGEEKRAVERTEPSHADAQAGDQPNQSREGSAPMPYHTENGVRTYHDHETPEEYASSADEERDAYNHAFYDAFNASELLTAMLDNRSGIVVCTSASMATLAEKITQLVAEVEAMKP